MGVSVGPVFDSIVIAELVDSRPFRGRAVYANITPAFGHRPFQNEGFSIYIQKTSDSDKVQDRRFRAITGDYQASLGNREFDFAADNIQKTAYHSIITFPLLNLNIPFVAGDEGDWWVMALPHGLDIETPRNTTGFECMKPFKLAPAPNVNDPPTEDGKLPNIPGLVVVEVRAGGVLRIHWFYDRSGEQATPSVFRIFHNDGSGDIDYDVVQDSEDYVSGQSVYTHNFTFSHNTTVTFSVRAETSDGDRETNTNTIQGTADAQGPPDVENLKSFGKCD